MPGFDSIKQPAADRPTAIIGARSAPPLGHLGLEYKALDAVLPAPNEKKDAKRTHAQATLYPRAAGGMESRRVGSLREMPGFEVVAESRLADHVCSIEALLVLLD